MILFSPQTPRKETALALDFYAWLILSRAALAGFIASLLRLPISLLLFATWRYFCFILQRDLSRYP
jgi:hypothetical protein